MKINDNEFDIEVKSKIKEEIKFIPDNINKAFDEALLKVQASKKKRNYKKVAGISAIFLSAGLLGFSVTPYAKNIPVLRNIYETFNRKVYENYDKYASDINITKENNGIGITINKVIYDGIDLEIFYTIEGEKILKTNSQFIYFQTGDFRINGEKLWLGGMGHAEYIEESKVYVGSNNYLINSGDMLPQNDKGERVSIPDEFLLTLEINEIDLAEKGSIQGNWSFDIKVSNEKIKNGVKEIELNKNLSSIQNGLILEEVILTPINTAILGRTDYNGYNLLDYIIIDDKGRNLEEKASSYRQESEDNIWGNIFMKRYKEIYEDAEKITIIPNMKVLSNPPSNYKIEENDIKWEQAEEMRIPLNLEGETKLLTKYGEDYGTITKVEIKEDKTIVYFKPTIGNYDVLFGIVEDENELNISYPLDKYYSNEEKTTKYNSETGEFIIEFHKHLSQGNYSIVYFDNSRNNIYFFDKAITVDIK